MALAVLAAAVPSIVFQRDAEGQGDGCGVVHVAATGEFFASAVLSGDGQRVAYTGAEGLVVANADGSSPTVVSEQFFVGPDADDYESAGGLFGLAMSEDGSTIAGSFSSDQGYKVAVFSGGPNAYGAPEILDGWLPPIVQRGQMSSDDQRLLVGDHPSVDEWILHDLDAGTSTPIDPPRPDRSYGARLSGDGTTIAVQHSASSNAQVVVLDADSGEEIAGIPDASAFPLSISADGQRVLYRSSSTRELRLFDAGTSRSLTFPSAQSTTLSADGTKAFFLDFSFVSIDVFQLEAFATADVDTGQLVNRTLNSYGAGDTAISEVSLSTDGSRAAFGSRLALAPEATAGTFNVYVWTGCGVDGPERPKVADGIDLDELGELGRNFVIIPGEDWPDRWAVRRSCGRRVRSVIAGEWSTMAAQPRSHALLSSTTQWYV